MSEYHPDEHLEFIAQASISKSPIHDPEGTENAIKYPKYWRKLPKNWVAVDIYRINQLFPIDFDKSDRITHARKKLLAPGIRTGGKSAYKDIKEAYDTIGAWLRDNEDKPNG